MKNSLEVESNTHRSPMGDAINKIQTYFNVINHIIVSIVAVYMSFLCYNAGNQPISWHAWLCALGVSILNIPNMENAFDENSLRWGRRTNFNQAPKR